MLFLFVVFVGGILLYFKMPTSPVKETKKEPQLIIRNTGKIFTQVDTSTYGKVPVQSNLRFEESETNPEELAALRDIFGN